ncbi:hypothetical protein ACFE04_026021 [Oxalis oulophora]
MTSSSTRSRLVNQLLTVIIQNRQFDAKLAATTNPNINWTQTLVSEILKSIPRHLFQSPRSIGRQPTTRHRTPLKQRRLNEESRKLQNDELVLGPTAYRDPQRVSLGLNKAVDFFHWVVKFFNFEHDDVTCKEMGIVLIKANEYKRLWEFLRQMAGKDEGKMVITTESVTCLIKVLGEQGLVNEALFTFHRMKQFRCKPDVYTYNTIIYALCKVGSYKKARFLLDQMELPAFWCPPDTYTYTIFISSYCKYAMQTGWRKAIRRRMWEANHMFRLMLFKGFVPDTVTYNCLIDGCCKTHRIKRAVELFEDMKERGCVPNRVTYDSFIRFYSVVNEIDKAIEMMRMMQETKHGVPSTSSYTPIIHALCEAGRVLEARDFLVELVEGGSIPREFTYKLVCDSLDSAGQSSLLGYEFHKLVKNGIVNRYNHVKKFKPIMSTILSS